ncbi:hypothetical protein [Halobacterium bonnevillei]|uniref:Uncharacterized protein n=1 Tax=Halobacterium bonnevillei TaxID=2692200 RepID=A0A6B0SMX9_9EURY|nr:hypothetical protein [Halobacterium bonnevillei]MXR20332.1 hypothetical protein [Halobacterium bonnevillei]
MKEHNDSGQELSAAQHDENDDGCPECGAPIRSVTRRGPSEVVIAPCGHNVAGTLARDFPRASERTNGDETATIRADGGTVARGYEQTSPEELPSEYRVETDDGDIVSIGRYRERTGNKYDVEARDEQRTRMREAVAAIRAADHDDVQSVEFRDPDGGPEFHVELRLVDDCKTTFRVASLLRKHDLRIYGVDIYDGHLAAWIHEEGWAEWSE